MHGRMPMRPPSSACMPDPTLFWDTSTSAARVFGQREHRRCDHHPRERHPLMSSLPACARRVRACPSPWLAIASTCTAPPRSPPLPLHMCWCAPVCTPHCPTHSLSPCSRVVGPRGSHARARKHCARCLMLALRSLALRFCAFLLILLTARRAVRRTGGWQTSSSSRGAFRSIRSALRTARASACPA